MKIFPNLLSNLAILLELHSQQKLCLDYQTKIFVCWVINFIFFVQLWEKDNMAYDFFFFFFFFQLPMK